MDLYNMLLAKKLGGGGGGVTIQYLAYGNCPTDDGATETNKPLTVTQYTEYEEYLTYDSTNNQFEVLKDFEAIIVPWVRCSKTAGGRPQMGLKINDSWIVRSMFAENEVNAVGGIGFTVDDYMTSQTKFANIPEFNGIRMKLSQGDTISLQKYNDTGWTDFNIKIYKLCGANSDIDNFMNSINTLSDTSTYKSAILSD